MESPVMEILGMTSLKAGEVKGRGRPQGAVGRIRHIHHIVAKLWASGMKPPEIARFVGRTPATIRNWIDSPANAELVAQYVEEVNARVGSMLEVRAQLREEISLMGLAQIRDQLAEAEEAGEALPLTTLLRIVDSADDRTGLGKQETRINMNMDLGDRLDAARKQAAAVVEARSAGNVVKFVRRI